MRDRTRLFLILSLVLNVFLLGAGGTIAWRWHMAVGGGWRGRAVEALAIEHQKPFRRAIRETVRESRDLMQQGRAARADAAAHFVQPQFDAATIKADLARARTADVTLRGRIEESVVDFAATLPIEERQKLAEVLKRGPLRQPRARKNGQASDGSATQPR